MGTAGTGPTVLRFSTALKPMCQTVDDFLFSISCTTCQARLKVRSETALGQILTCPKCGSMVQILPPPDWQANRQSESPTAEGGKRDDVPTDDVSQASDLPNSPPASPPEPSAAPVGTDALEGPESWALSATAVSPTEVLWRKWLLVAAVPVAGLVITVTGWSILSSPNGPAEPPGPQAQTSAPPADELEPLSVQPPSHTTLVQPGTERKLVRRWLPPQARLFASLRLSKLSDQLSDQEQFTAVARSADGAWHASLETLLRTFGVIPQAVRRLSWSVTDLDDWLGHSVVVIELNEDQDAGMLNVLGDPFDLQLDGTTCRRLHEAGWPHPFAVLDQWTMVTGDEELLRELGKRIGESPEGGLVPQFLDAAAPEADVAVVVDLAAARQAGWRSPAWLMDVWPAGRQSWHTLWELPGGLGLTVRLAQADSGHEPSGTGSLQGELALICDGQTTADQVQAATSALVPAARTALSAKIESLTGELESGRLTAEAADQYQLLLEHGRRALDSARWEVVDQTVWLRIAWEAERSTPATVAGTAGVIRTEWLAAARAADEAKHQRLLSGLGGYLKAEGHFPSGAGGGQLLPPETRLSWIATMLPYYGHLDWHRELSFGYPWNSPENGPVSRRPLDLVVNPALGPGTTGAGFPVTHYVGVAGLGPDAGQLPASDPRAGVFGFSRISRPENITDGLSNTIATVGVSAHLGAWAAGGNSTVRGFTRRPYVNGPDGFGSGQSDGMLVGMADGSVRFLSGQIDPHLVEQLVTAGGGEQVTVARLEPEGLLPPEPKPEEPAAARGQDDNPPPQPPAADAGGEAAVSTEPEIDVEARLGGRIGGIQLPGVPLADVVALVGQLSGLRIAIDADALGPLGVELDDPLTVRLSEASIGEVLQAVLAERGLVYLVEGDHLVVTNPRQLRGTLRTVRYAVGDLADGPQQTLAELADLVESLVAPESWQSAGGRGSIIAEQGTLTVSQTDAIHYRVLVFCEKLRVARGLPLRSSGYRPELFSLTPQAVRAAGRLGRTVTANFPQPTPLATIVAELEERSGSRILIDWSALAAEGLSGRVDRTLGAVNQPLSAALDELLKPLGLATRIVGDDVVQITTADALGARLELQFYPLADALAKSGPVEALTQRLKSEVAGDTWDDAGGPGVLYFDHPSQCLVVLQSQPVQVRLQQALGKMGKGN